MEIETLSTETYVADALTRFHFQCKLHGFCSDDQTTSTASFVSVVMALPLSPVKKSGQDYILELGGHG